MTEVSRSDIERLARLARLEVAEEGLETVRGELSAVLGWMDKLGELDLEGVEPMFRPETGGGVSEGLLGDDEPGRVLSNDIVMGLAPEPSPPFFRVPRVLGEGGGA
jgi:aspartyl-tRNA(Asn)/glutamyl-tRNA(Gln) amidotransferase subunit C